MTGPKGNSEFCFSEILNVFWGKAKGNIGRWGGGGTKLSVSCGVSQKVFCYTSQLKNRKKNCKKNYFLDGGWHGKSAAVLRSTFLFALGS